MALFFGGFWFWFWLWVFRGSCVCVSLEVFCALLGGLFGFWASFFPSSGFRGVLVGDFVALLRGVGCCGEVGG